MGNFSLFYAGMPEWSNGTGLGPVSLVLTKVRILVSALEIFINHLKLNLLPASLRVSGKLMLLVKLR